MPTNEKELADFLTRVSEPREKGWSLSSLREPGECRQIFQVADVFHFKRANPGGDRKLLLNVHGQETTNVGGRKKRVFPVAVDLTFVQDADGMAFMVEAYGRQMRFGYNGPLQMKYSGVYLTAPHGHPDESGEGDPTIPPDDPMYSPSE